MTVLVVIQNEVRNLRRLFLGKSWRREKRRPLRTTFRGDSENKGDHSSLTLLGVTPYPVILSEAKDLKILGRGAPFPTDRILVVLSVAKDLRLISPERQKINFGWSWWRRAY
jgi:hypothetical protein